MTDFITRIELHDGTGDDYLAVHNAMKNLHFTDRLSSKFGVAYELPRGSYFSQSHNMAASEVRNMALMATRAVTCWAEIITVSGDISFFLSPADSVR